MKTKRSVGQTTRHRKRSRDTANYCMGIFTPRYRDGDWHRGSSTINSRLTLEWVGYDIIIKFSASVPGMGKGVCSVKVRQNGVLVLEARGEFLAGPHDVIATTYVRGDWENKLPLHSNHRL